jgi:sugar/nucleoside kinase (ribokinase family)
VVKTGSTGCWGATKHSLHQHPAYPVNVIDTTGAGDLFASGFLHGYLINKPLEECLRYGAFMASRVIMDFGAQIPEDKWPEIRKACR